MKIGTKSVLYGAHAFWLHPWFVAAAWWKLYGFPWDPRLWVAFFVHDLGYFGKPNMDGPEGEGHPKWGARVMLYWFEGVPSHPGSLNRRVACAFDRLFGRLRNGRMVPWHDLVMHHSRFLAKRQKAPPSRLCPADKLAVALEPWWLYLPRVIATGEIDEYMEQARQRGDGPAGDHKYASMALNTDTRRRWFSSMAKYLRAWAYEHRDGRADTWTPEQLVAPREEP